MLSKLNCLYQNFYICLAMQFIGIPCSTCACLINTCSVWCNLATWLYVATPVQNIVCTCRKHTCDDLFGLLPNSLIGKYCLQVYNMYILIITCCASMPEHHKSSDGLFCMYMYIVHRIPNLGETVMLCS